MITFLSFKDILTSCGSFDILTKFSLCWPTSRIKDIRSDGQSGKGEIFIFVFFKKVLYCYIIYFKEGGMLSGLYFALRMIMDHYVVGLVGFLRAYLSMQ